LPKAAVQHPWDTQWINSAAPTDGDLAGAFSNADLALVGNRILTACDDLDGLVDGMVNNFPACTSALVNLASLQCTGAKDATCLTGDQINALEAMYGGAKNSSEELLYSDWPWDAGVSASGWRAWKMGPTGPTPLGRIQLLGGSSLPYIFTTPPVATPDPVGFLFDYDFDTQAPLIYETYGPYLYSAMEFMTPPDPTMQKLKDQGGKMIVYHGVSDPVFSANDTINWYENEFLAADPDGADFVRLFLVPGMNHCSGGVACDEFGTLSTIVDWVENGVAPSAITATARASNADAPWAGRTRPLCPWPEQARYNGTGDIEDAANFTCQDP